LAALKQYQERRAARTSYVVNTSHAEWTMAHKPGRFFTALRDMALRSVRGALLVGSPRLRYLGDHALMQCVTLLRSVMPAPAVQDVQVSNHSNCILS
jgi:hypothetical protein